MLTIGLVHNWPGAKNSELDIILRIQLILRGLGHEGIIIDPMGAQLNEQALKIGDSSKKHFDLVLNLHYLNPKYMPALSYTVNWNPLAYIIDNPITKKPLPIKQFSYLVDCLRTHDRVLSAGSTLVDHYASSTRATIKRPWLKHEVLTLHTSIESTGASLLPKSLNSNNAKVFYIGVNWEKLSQDKNKQIRHEGLFETLDQSNLFEFYGLKELAGVSLWQGIKSYCGELPFDGGISIIEKTKQCGLTLVLSSEQHRQSELVSTRIFQACKAGAIIITDRNAFIEKYFGDSVLYFEYGSSAKETADNILAQVAWAKQNWQIALEKAEIAQNVFIEHFALELEVNAIVNQAVIDNQNKQKYIINLSNNPVAVIYHIREFNESELLRCIENISLQNHRNITLIVHTVQALKPEIYELTKNTNVNVEYIISNFEQSLGRCLTEHSLTKFSYFIVYSPGFDWHVDHVFELISLLINSEHLVSVSPLFIAFQNLKKNDETMDFFIKGLNGGFANFSIDNLTQLNCDNFPLGNILINTSVLNEILAPQEVLAQFDLAAIMVLLLCNKNRLNNSIVNLANITSEFVHNEFNDDYFEYDQYTMLGKSGLDYKQRDRNALTAIGRYFLDATMQSVLSTKLILWEAEQMSGYLSTTSHHLSVVQLNAQIERLQKQVAFIQSSNFSKQFSVKIYLKHLFRNSPIISSVLSKFFSLFSKILKV